MKRTLLSVSVALALTVPTQVLAAGASDSDSSGSFFDEALQFGGHVGTSYEYESKNITDYNKWGGGKSKERIKTHELINVFYKNPTWDLSAFYAYKLAEREKTSSGYAENENSNKHLISLDKGFKLPNGWTTGLIYELEYTKGKINSTSGTVGLQTTNAEHSVRPYLTYWNNEYSMGFYSNLEYLFNDEDKNAWGTREEEGYSLLFKPYKRFGNWELGVEFFYQTKDNEAKNADGSINEVSDFTEKYFEPIVQYSFEDAGTLYARARFGDNETKFTDGWAKNETFFKDIRKATLGYEQAVGEDWLVKAEYEWAEEDETFTQLAGDKKEIEQETFYVQALYRF